MKVTPIDRKFGKHRPGDVFELPDKAAKLFIRIGKLRAAEPAAEPVPQTYQTRAMLAAPIPEPVHAPYGFKADGTPRLRPAPNARPKVSE